MYDLALLVTGEYCLDICLIIWNNLSFNETLNLRILNKHASKNINEVLFKKACERKLYFVIKRSTDEDIDITYRNIRDYSEDWLPEKYTEAVLSYTKAPVITNKSTAFIKYVKFESLRKLFNELRQDPTRTSFVYMRLDKFYQYPLVLQFITLNGYELFMRNTNAYKILILDTYLSPLLKHIDVQYSSELCYISFYLNTASIVVIYNAIYLNDTYENFSKIYTPTELMNIRNDCQGPLFICSLNNMFNAFILVKKYIEYKFPNIPNDSVNVLIETMFYILNISDEIFGNTKYEEEVKIALDLFQYLPFVPEDQVYQLAQAIYACTADTFNTIIESTLAGIGITDTQTIYSVTDVYFKHCY